ncbi:hypothetical protein ABZ858_28335 [Streptomyces sp. NPDC047017]|uniref:hypothetical protein n=1 Tax=Streptomyces sp. NPDC047017 TaxID=3155024 RepID=UPI00340E6B93
MSGRTLTPAQAGRARHPSLWAVGTGCYVLAAIAGMFALADRTGPALLIPLWIVHAGILILLLRKLGARESSTYAMLFVLATSLMSVYVAGMARDVLTLQRRGEQVSAEVVRQWRDPAEGRKARDYNYELRRPDGSKVPGPPLKTSSDSYDIGQTLTVIEDPKGVLRPRTPAQANATGEMIGSAAFALCALAAVAWMAWRGSAAVMRRGENEPAAGATLRKAYKAVTRNHSTRAEQEQRLREALRAHPADRRGYIKLHPEDYPDLSQQQAARIAWETGLRAEAAGNRGSWRFKENVVEEVPFD